MAENGGNGLNVGDFGINFAGTTPEAFRAEFRRTPEAERSQMFYEEVCASLAKAHERYVQLSTNAPDGRLPSSAIIFADIEAAQAAPHSSQQDIPLL